METIVVTGATGFAGRCIIADILKYTDYQVVAMSRSEGPTEGRLTSIRWDIREPLTEGGLKWLAASSNIRYFIHAAAEVHALRSLADPVPFAVTNVIGTVNVLEAVRKLQMDTFAYISSVEVLGGRDVGYSLEHDEHRPSNPYAATKAAGEDLTYSYFKAFDVPAIIVRSSNLYGEGQDDESKFVPMVTALLKAGKPVKIHVQDGKPGMRQWSLGSTFAHSLMDLLPRAKHGETYHIMGEEFTNLEMATRIAEQLGLPLKCELVRISKTHEFRYAMQASQ